MDEDKEIVFCYSNDLSDEDCEQLMDHLKEQMYPGFWGKVRYYWKRFWR